MPEDFRSYDYPTGASPAEQDMVNQLDDLAFRQATLEDRMLVQEAVAMLTRMVKSRNRYRAFDEGWDKPTVD